MEDVKTNEVITITAGIFLTVFNITQYESALHEFKWPLTTSPVYILVDCFFFLISFSLLFILILFYFMVMVSSYLRYLMVLC
jgi:hypothetical protein